MRGRKNTGWEESLAYLIGQHRLDKLAVVIFDANDVVIERFVFQTNTVEDVHHRGLPGRVCLAHAASRAEHARTELPELVACLRECMVRMMAVESVVGVHAKDEGTRALSRALEACVSHVHGKGRVERFEVMVHCEDGAPPHPEWLRPDEHAKVSRSPFTHSQA